MRQLVLRWKLHVQRRGRPIDVRDETKDHTPAPLEPMLAGRWPPMICQLRAPFAALLIAFACSSSACTYDFTIPERADGGDVKPDGPATNGDPRTVSCGPACECAAGQSCDLQCSGVNACTPTCASGSVCTVSCKIGMCQVVCAANATCEIDCGAGTCNTDCQGTCKIKCGAGQCLCSGPGCP